MCASSEFRDCIVEITKGDVRGKIPHSYESYLTLGALCYLTIYDPLLSKHIPTRDVHVQY